MGRLRGNAVALLALACLACVLVAAPAGGAAKATVTVGIGYDPSGPSPYFRGRLRSSRPTCITDRPVRVFYQRNQGALTFFGATRSDEKGFWRVPLAEKMKVGGYLAVVKAKPGCLKASSNPQGISR